MEVYLAFKDPLSGVFVIFDFKTNKKLATHTHLSFRVHHSN